MEKQLKSFTKYQVFVIVILALTVFTVVLDFMVLSPLGSMMLRVLKITPRQFALVVSAYALSAGASGFLSAGFADKYDRKKLLLFFYMGFILGTLFCALAQTFPMLLLARIVTGIFGGVISSISFAIITDLFEVQQRGRVMGFVQSSFALSQVMGVPIGLYLANTFDWHTPFFTIVGLSLLIVFVIYFGLNPITEHLKIKREKNAMVHLFHTMSNRTYLKGFAALSLLSMGGFLLMPFSSPFLVNNLHIAETKLPLLFMFTGLCTLATGPVVGRLADGYGKMKVFFWGSILTSIMVLYYTQMQPMNFAYVVLINCLLFMGVSSRLISGSALMTQIPNAADRGAYMGVNSSIQQISGGIGSILAGLVIVQGPNNELQNYNVLGYITVGMLIACLYLMWIVNGIITKSNDGQI